MGVVTIVVEAVLELRTLVVVVHLVQRNRRDARSRMFATSPLGRSKGDYSRRFSFDLNLGKATHTEEREDVQLRPMPSPQFVEADGKSEAHT